MAPRDVSIIVPNFNGERLLPEFLPSVVEAADSYAGGSEILVVDDASRDRSREVIQELASRHPRIRPIFAESNGGFPVACNLGARSARHDVLFFLNSDVALSSGYFDRFTALFEDPSVFAVVPAGYRHGSGEQLDGVKRLEFRRGFFRFTSNVLNDAIGRSGVRPPHRSWGGVGAYLWIDARRFRELGGFDEIYAPFLLEETDLLYRGLKRGWTIAYDPDAVGWHRVSATIPDGRVSSATLRVHRRNRLVFHWSNLHAPGLLARHVAFLAARLLLLWPGEWRALRDVWPLLPAIRERRRREREQALVTDSELLRRARHDVDRYRRR